MDDTSSEDELHLAPYEADDALMSSEQSNDEALELLHHTRRQNRYHTLENDVPMLDDVLMVDDEPEEFDISAVYDVSTVRSSTPELPSNSVIHPNPPNPEISSENASRQSPCKEPEITGSPKNHRRVEESTEDDGQTCTICFEPWTNSSEHRLVSLRCGHLFGRSCITRWLKGQNSRCPQCNARARKSEIRNIYAKTVKAIDSTERDKALEDLQKESEKRRKAEMEASTARLNHAMKVAECEMLKKQLMEANKLLQEYRSNSKGLEKSQSTTTKASVFTLEKCLDLAKNGGCRLIDVCELLSMVLVSQPSTNELFPGFGFRKISTMEMRPSEFVLVHQKPIKDMAFHCHDGLVLTASLDKSVKITNVLTNSVVHTYSVDSDAWSCAWDFDNPTYFYTGVKSSGVYLFDIRVTNRYVKELPNSSSRTPVVAMQYHRKLPYATQSKCGPIVGKLADCGFFQKMDEEGEYSVIPLPLTGPFTSLSAEPNSGHFLVSCRPSKHQPNVTHTLCELVSDSGCRGIQCNPVQTIQGGRNQVQLTRSKLLPHPDDASSLLICAGDEDAQGALIWDGSSGKSLDRLRTDSPVLDMANLKSNQKSILLSLTDKTLRLYSWNS